MSLDYRRNTTPDTSASLCKPRTYNRNGLRRQFSYLAHVHLFEPEVYDTLVSVVGEMAEIPRFSRFPVERPTSFSGSKGTKVGKLVWLHQAI